MSTDTALANNSFLIKSDGAYALRFGFGITAALIIAWIVDVPIAFLAPIFAVSLLAPTAAAPSVAIIIALPVVIGLLSLLVEAIGGFFATWTDVLVLLFALVLFVCFHSDAVRGPGAVTGLVLTVALVVGTLAANADPVAGQIINSMFLAALAASLAALLVFAIWPLPRQQSGGSAAAEKTVGPGATAAKRSPVKIALARTAIGLPIVIWFIAEDVVGNFFVLLVAINILRIDVPTRGSLIAIAANIVGAGVALLFMVMADSVQSELFAILLFIGVALVFGLELQKGGDRAQVAQTAISTTIVLIALTLAPVDQSGQAFDRIVLVLATAVYVLLARAALERS